MYLCCAATAGMALPCTQCTPAPACPCCRRLVACRPPPMHRAPPQGAGTWRSSTPPRPPCGATRRPCGTRPLMSCPSRRVSAFFPALLSFSAPGSGRTPHRQPGVVALQCRPTAACWAGAATPPARAQRRFGRALAASGSSTDAEVPTPPACHRWHPRRSWRWPARQALPLKQPATISRWCAEAQRKTFCSWLSAASWAGRTCPALAACPARPALPHRGAGGARLDARCRHGLAACRSLQAPTAAPPSAALPRCCPLVPPTDRCSRTPRRAGSCWAAWWAQRRLPSSAACPRSLWWPRTQRPTLWRGTTRTR